jgi:hypothetical protein
VDGLCSVEYALAAADYEEGAAEAEGALHGTRVDFRV